MAFVDLSAGERIYASQLRTQGGGGFSQNFLEGLLTEFGITRADVLGFIHNHNASNYCLGASDYQEANQLNRQPSGNDWNTRDWFIRGGASASEFTMYVMSCNGSGVYAYGPGSLPGFQGDPVEGETCPEDEG
jgi:hypothetical protein